MLFPILLALLMAFSIVSIRHFLALSSISFVPGLHKKNHVPDEHDPRGEASPFADDLLAAETDVAEALTLTTNFAATGTGVFQEHDY